jgi:hypothetical protein
MCGYASTLLDLQPFRSEKKEQENQGQENLVSPHSIIFSYGENNSSSRDLIDLVWEVEGT